MAFFLAFLIYCNMYFFYLRFLSEIEMDAAYDFTHARAVMSELNIAGASAFDLAVIRYICECVTCRAAELAGAGIASLVNKIGRRRVTIGMDGSLYKFHPHLGRRINQSMKRMVNDSIKFELALSEDGSGRGAALASAVAVKLELKRKRNLEKKMEKNTAQ
jgi:hexokinase